MARMIKLANYQGLLIVLVGALAYLSYTNYNLEQDLEEYKGYYKTIAIKYVQEVMEKPELSVPDPEEFDDMDKESEKAIKDLGSDVGVLMEQNHLDRALKKILQFSAHFNQYFQHKEPWKKAHGTGSCVYLSVNAVRSLAIAIYPFLPKSSQKIWMQLGMDGDVSAQPFDEISNITIKQGHKLGEISPLFEKVEESVIEEQKKKLGI